MVSLRSSLLTFGIGATALVISGAPAYSAVFDGPAPSSAAGLAAAHDALVTDKAVATAEPRARLLVAQNDPARQGRPWQGSTEQAPDQAPGRTESGRRGHGESLPPGPPDWIGGKPPAVPPVSPRRPLG